ncbi:unnamed protein product [Closterium sp. NIES-53]
MKPGGGISQVRGFNGAIQVVQGCSTFALQGEAEKLIHIPDMLYVPVGVDLDGDSGAADDRLRDEVGAEHLACSTCAHQRRHDQSHTGTCRSCRPGDQAIDQSRLALRLLRQRKLTWQTFPNKGSKAKNALDIVHFDLYGLFRVVANDGSLYFLLLKDRKTRFVWVRPIAAF